MKPARLAAECGLYTALAFALAYLEHLIPAVPVPGFKLGLANIVTLAALYRLGFRLTLPIVTARCILASLLFGQLGSLAFSLCGGLLALCAMALLRRRKALSVYGVSMAGAAAHNAGQTLAAALTLASPAVFGYLVFLLPLSIPTGILTAYLYAMLSHRLQTSIKSNRNPK